MTIFCCSHVHSHHCDIQLLDSKLATEKTEDCVHSPASCANFVDPYKGVLAAEWGTQFAVAPICSSVRDQFSEFNIAHALTPMLSILSRP